MALKRNRNFLPFQPGDRVQRGYLPRLATFVEYCRGDLKHAVIRYSWDEPPVRVQVKYLSKVADDDATSG